MYVQTTFRRLTYSFFFHFSEFLRPYFIFKFYVDFCFEPFKAKHSFFVQQTVSRLLLTFMMKKIQRIFHVSNTKFIHSVIFTNHRISSSINICGAYVKCESDVNKCLCFKFHIQNNLQLLKNS